MSENKLTRVVILMCPRCGAKAKRSKTAPRYASCRDCGASGFVPGYGYYHEHWPVGLSGWGANHE